MIIILSDLKRITRSAWIDLGGNDSVLSDNCIDRRAREHPCMQAVPTLDALRTVQRDFQTFTKWYTHGGHIKK